jgi:hypothetical protein
MTVKLLWPVEGDQSVAVPYSGGSMEIAAVQGTLVRAVMEGTITNTSDEWLQISAPEAVVVYTGVQEIRVQDSQPVIAGMLLAQVGPGGKIGIMVYQPVDPTGFFEAPVTPSIASTAAVDAEAAQAENLLLTPTMDGLRIREMPVDGKPVGTLKLDEVVESLEPADVTKSKLGVEGQWLHIKRADGTSAYTAAWLLKTTDSRPFAKVRSTSLLGMNLDIFHPQGRPDPMAMQGVGWVRIKFNVSFNPDNGTYGNRDIEAAYQRYLPQIERYAQGGLKVLMVFTHQLFGEGAGFDWKQMDSGRWRQLVPTYADFARQVAAKFNGTGLISCYQIWNEQDTEPKNARAAVPIPAADYGYMLTETIRAIRQADQMTAIITGGHTTGPESGSAYARATLGAMPPDVRPDGLAFHPYGRGVKGHRFSNWGPLSEEIDAYSGVLPDKPLWITEWGVLDHQGRADVIGDVCDYCGGFMDILKKDYPDKVAAAIWYAWADGMDNGFGLVDSGGNPKPTIYDQWRTLG